MWDGVFHPIFQKTYTGKLLAEGDDTTQLSAGDTVVLKKTKSQKDDAIAALRDLGETRLTSERFAGYSKPITSTTPRSQDLHGGQASTTP